MSDCPQLERTHAFADGELAAADASAAREHLATCAICQAELAEILQLDAAVAQLPRTAGAKVISLAWYRKRRVQVAAAAAIAAAACFAVYVAVPKHRDAPQHAPQIALAEHRAIEARLSWSGAAAYRPYDVPRGEAPHESVPLTSLAAVEQSGDAHGVGVLALLNGDRRQAQAYLDKARDSADVISDRAALAILDNHPERALALADAALAIQPTHAAATWNRALALRDLGLPRAAAAAFRDVAARSEAGWAAEATARAQTLDAETDARRDRANRVNAGGAQLVKTGAGITADDARAELGLARLWLYDAIRAASSADRLAALAPLADAVDAADHTDAMTAALARAKAHLHPALSDRYGALVAAIAARDAASIPTGPARAKLLADLRAAHADDLLIGALVKLAPDYRTVDPAELPEFAKLTAASPDPWMQLLGIEQQATAALHASDFARAEALLVGARTRCAQGGPLLRCSRVDQFLIDLYLQTQRLPEAHALLDAAWKRARGAGAWFEESVLLPQYAQLYVFSDDTNGSGLPLARAYVGETERRHAEYDPPTQQCRGMLWGRTTIATVLVNQLRLADAKAELPADAPCDRPTLDGIAANIFVRAEVVRDAGSLEERAKLRADIASLRAAPGASPSQLAIAAQAEGRVLIDGDPAAAIALLRSAIDIARKAPGDATAQKTSAYSYAVLVLDAAKRGDGAAALQLVAEEQHLDPPAACALGLAVDGRRRAAFARGTDGAFAIHYDETRAAPAIDAAALVTKDLTAALAACPSVSVIARPPIDGTPRLLGDAVAWRYLVPRAHPLAATPAAGRSLVVANVEPPPVLELPRLATWATKGEAISGADATPARVLAAIGSAGDVVIHAHGLVDLASPDASFLALSPDADGRFALTAGDVRASQFATAPLVVLAACRASQAAPVFHEAWSLPAAFVYAGARAVIASAAPIPDAEAGAFFDDVRARAAGGAAVAVALRDARQAWLAAHKGDWVRDVMVFE